MSGFPLTVLLGDPTLPDATKPGGAFNPEDLDARKRMQTALGSLTGYTARYLDRHDRLLTDLQERPPGLVLNFCDTGFRNNPAHELHIAALLEFLALPYSGAAPSCMAVCFDKALVCAAAAEIGIAAPEEQYFACAEDAYGRSFALPALIKPNQADGSLGITKDAVVGSAAAADAYLHSLAEVLPGRAILVQEYLAGTEYGVGVIGNPTQQFDVLPVIEVDYSNLPAGLAPILGYESKTIPGSPYWTDIRYRLADLAADRRRELTDQVTRLFIRLGCRDYARFDWRCDSTGQIKLLEVNPNPAWAWDGKLAMMAAFADVSYAVMLRMIIETARRRLRL
ncbi:MAG: D-alanine--D-alanine ligase [Alphaproteobacteria bacterium]|nr:D-alanine--D-alanine ligase [Alphaproteobacteria bacterium]